MKIFIFTILVVSTLSGQVALLGIREDITEEMTHVAELAEDFSTIMRTTTTGIDKEIAISFADYAGDCYDYLVFARNLLDILNVTTGKENRRRVEALMNENKENLIGLLEIKTKYVSEVLPLIQNNYLTLRGSELRAKMRKVTELLQSFEY